MNSLIIFSAKYLFLLSLFLFAWYFFMSSRELRRKIMNFGVFLLPLSYLLGLLSRSLYENPRPFVLENFEPLISHAADNGFPSDHTLLLASLAVLITFFHRKLGVTLWVITILVGVSRVMAGVHHLTDILGSIAIALISAGLVYFVLDRQKKV